MSELDEKRITRKITTIDISIKQIAAYLSMIEQSTIEPDSGFSLISKHAKSIAWECDRFFPGEVKNE